MYWSFFFVLRVFVLFVNAADDTDLREIQNTLKTAGDELLFQTTARLFPMPVHELNMCRSLKPIGAVWTLEDKLE